MQKRIRITRHISCHGGFQLLVNEKYNVIYEGYSNEKKQNTFMVATNVIKNGTRLPLVVYENECEQVFKA